MRRQRLWRSATDTGLELGQLAGPSLTVRRHDIESPTRLTLLVRKILHYPVAAYPNLVSLMSTDSSEGEILTIKQVAEYLKVTDRTIYRLAGAKKIPAFKVGGTWRFSRADLDTWIRRQSAEPVDRDGPSDTTGVNE
jgi:excisionase family DNA binding protein